MISLPPAIEGGGGGGRDIPKGLWGKLALGKKTQGCRERRARLRRITGKKGGQSHLGKC